MANTKNELLKTLQLPQDELFESLNTVETGYTQAIAEEKLEEFGPNQISPSKKRHPIIGFVNVLINPFNLVLMVVIAITFVTDILLTQQRDYLTITILSVIVIISTLISFIQDERSSAASEKLLHMVSNTTAALRDGAFIEIPIDQLVVGDIVRLSAGDIVPADMRVISAKDLFLSQATLTGESQPIEKFVSFNDEETSNEADYSNLCLMGTNVVSGTARAVVIRTGDDTYLGKMSTSLKETRRPNSFENSISTISRLLMRLMIIMLPIIIVINGLFKKDFIDALLFALTVAVGLTPEMLPVVLSSGLARGAINMAKHQTIVKSQSSISSFGEMDVLCTDKTGTITQDDIILERYMNVTGEDDMRVLRHAFLNSQFQSGLKNLIDLAIIERANMYNMGDLIHYYTVVDEIPFDFARRRMSVILEDSNDKRQLITKGAVEEIMSLCKYIDRDGEAILLTDEIRAEAMDVYSQHNHDGLRMIAVAQKNDVPTDHEFSVEDEKDLVLIGFIGFLDPPKESAKPTIESLNRHGVDVVVITGDSLGVAKKVCSKVGIDTEVTYMGDDIEAMTDKELGEAVKHCHLFAKISPSQKQRIVKAFQDNHHTVGFMGDGINDALALKQADVGISVDTAVDIAKESADIILLKKDLSVLEEGVLEGRKTIVNMVKYLEMAVSGNVGNMISVIVASIFLPFLPLLPVHILVQNLLSDLAQTGIPFDNCTPEELEKPRKLETKSLVRFMSIFGPLSSIFDIACFLVLYFVFNVRTVEQQTLFHTFWFAFGIMSQALIIFVIRSKKPLSRKNPPSFTLVLVTVVAIAITLLFVLTPMAASIELQMLQPVHIAWVFGIIAMYLMTTTIVKKFVYTPLD
ncbi:magnesium-translocating P-type ATPase [Erysipelothrix sp. HDW6C]|uniref:magnesium-translocating P-type ATPase n=1 Tax=Erysipelothrix sp. HDW6C TaxID=2714930 RepID=UPI0014094C64|nr:magnesium-translocating P-type ATPase [Erysipelothrix sp. HDW6C]QIK69903.1 magnesium-translocating P-type ATPase [Erysipelothrix sp. HDW6C]